MGNSQPLIPYQLESKAFTIGAGVQINTTQIPKTMNGKHVHVAKISIRAEVTPTFSAGTMTPQNLNVAVKRFELKEGTENRFQGGFNELRIAERLQNGKFRLSDPDNGATTVLACIDRVWNPGPVNYAGAPRDFLLPAAILDQTIDVGFGAAADFTVGGVTATVLAGTLYTTVWIALLPDINIPPFYEFKATAVSAADVPLSGRALYDVIALADSAAYGDFAAGEVANVSLDLGEGLLFGSVPARVLAAGFADDKNAGELGGVAQGENVGATDDNFKQVNRASAAAVVGAANDLQPVLWSPLSAYIQKALVCNGTARLKWSGTQATAVVFTGRFLPQPKGVMNARIQKCIAHLNGAIPKAITFRTLDEIAYNKKGENDKRDFLPVTVSM